MPMQKKKIIYHHQMTPMQQYQSMFQNMNGYYMSMMEKNPYYEPYKKDNPYWEYLKGLEGYQGHEEYGKMYI